MKFLLDSHALIWALSDPERLPEPVRELLEDPAHEIFVSAASAWEIAIKVGQPPRALFIFSNGRKQSGLRFWAVFYGGQGGGPLWHWVWAPTASQ